MRRVLMLFLVGFLVSCGGGSSSKANLDKEVKEALEYAMVIHGGAGTILKSKMSDSLELKYEQKLAEVLEAGKAILKKGGTAQEAVVESIKIMEDSPLFNAGKGAVFANSGMNEMDASIMRGKDQNGGAVAGVKNVRNPITAAVAVLEESSHVLLVGDGASLFAEKNGCVIVDPSYFYTERRMKALEKAKSQEDLGQKFKNLDSKFGTVGCVALDKYGNIVAGTSTGGMTNKKYSRIGDSPILGAGCYADNATCGISSTGHGEYFIRYAVAFDIAARMEYKGLTIEQAAEEVVMDKLVEKGGSGGIVGLDKYGNIAMTFNTEGMYRGYITPTERIVRIYKEQ